MAFFKSSVSVAGGLPASPGVAFSPAQSSLFAAGMAHTCKELFFGLLFFFLEGAGRSLLPPCRVVSPVSNRNESHSNPKPDVD